MTTEQAIKIGDLIIDEETGEILECPEGIGDRLEWLTHLEVEAKTALNAWKQALGMYHTAIGNLLDQAGQKRIETAHGIPCWRSRLNRRARPDNLPEIKEMFELSDAQVNAILTTAKELDVRRLETLEEQGIPRSAIRGLIDESESSWVQVDAIRKPPPDIERVPRKEADGGDGD